MDNVKTDDPKMLHMREISKADPIELLEKDKRIKYWVYEIEMPDETLEEIREFCGLHELTKDEYFKKAVKYCLNLGKNDPEGLKRIKDEMQSGNDAYGGIRLVRFYPIYEGETEAVAFKRRLSEEAGK